METLKQILLLIIISYTSGILLHKFLFKPEKILILDIAIWRCGGECDINSNRLGEGRTMLLNSFGFMCCLGQFSIQINKDINKVQLDCLLEPSDIVTRKLGILLDDDLRNSELSYKAIEINDDINTTVTYKIELLKKLFKKEGYKIQVINEHLIPN